MTSYQKCHRHFGYLTRETDIARELLEKHGRASVQAVKELRGETDMPMGECADMLRCLRRDMELERLQVENEKLRELVEAMPYCMTRRCLECPFCSKFDPSIGGAPECMAGAKLRELGVEEEA